MHNVTFALEGAMRVLVVGLLLGAGLPAVFALGVRALAYGQGGDAEVSHDRPHPAGKLLAGLAFAVVIGGVVLGLTVIVASGFGMEVVFDPFPTLVEKE
ncbi:hypothetical protein GCM10023168_02550 [Fodinibacter luteus]|uniref:Transmembrane protein n=1 Tax=Fodinibacter luteus TaxID=552064 RepID=A0ABP8JY44_9MICO